MKIITFNLNGIRSSSKKGFFEWLANQGQIDACLFQELKANDEDVQAFDPVLKAMGFSHVQWHCAQQKGYAGTGLCSREVPDAHFQGFGIQEFDDEGRLCHARYGRFELASIYFPSGSAGPHRQESKIRFLEKIRPWLDQRIADPKSHCLIGADLNIAHANIDLKNWKGNVEAPGCTAVEREWMTHWLDSGWIDCSRALRPDDSFYTWWSPRAGSRSRDVGWRIDAQIASVSLAQRALNATVFKDPTFSDHAPLLIEYEGHFKQFV